MKGCVVALPPTCNFPGGCVSYAYYAAKLLDSPIYAPSGIDMCLASLSPDKVEFPYGDYSLITSLNTEIPDLPRPMIAVVHDGHTFYEYGGKEWAKKMDGFIVDVHETAPMIRSIVPDAKILQLKLPYIPFDIPEIEVKKRKDVVVSLGRIVPEKGHRIVANLASLGYEVWIIGQHVDHEEYELYYQKIKRMGVTIFPNPTESEKRELLLQAKIYVGFSFTYEIGEPVEYSALEAMNCGLFPITSFWTKRYYREAGLYSNHAECSVDLSGFIDSVFRSSDWWSSVTKYNLEIIKIWGHDYRQRVEEFVNEIRRSGDSA